LGHAQGRRQAHGRGAEAPPAGVCRKTPDRQGVQPAGAPSNHHEATGPGCGREGPEVVVQLGGTLENPGDEEGLQDDPGALRRRGRLPDNSRDQWGGGGDQRNHPDREAEVAWL